MTSVCLPWRLEFCPGSGRNLEVFLLRPSHFLRLRRRAVFPLGAPPPPFEASPTLPLHPFCTFATSALRYATSVLWFFLFSRFAVWSRPHPQTPPIALTIRARRNSRRRIACFRRLITNKSALSVFAALACTTRPPRCSRWLGFPSLILLVRWLFLQVLDEVSEVGSVVK